MKLYVYKSKNYENSWSARIGQKEEVYWMDVTFAKCQAPAKDKATVNAVDFFLGTFKTRDGAVKPKIVIMDYDVVRDQASDKTK